MINKISSILDTIADSLEDQGLIREAYEVDVISNSLDSTSSVSGRHFTSAAQVVRQTVSVANIRNAIESIPRYIKSTIPNINNILQKLVQLSASSPRKALNAMIELAVGKGGTVEQIISNNALLIRAITAINSKVAKATTQQRESSIKEITAVDGPDTGMPSIDPKYGFEIFVAFTAFFEPPPTDKQKIVKCITRLHANLPKDETQPEQTQPGQTQTT